MEEHGENFVGFFSLFSVCKNKNNIASIEKANVDEKKTHTQPYARQAGRQWEKEKKDWLLVMWEREKEKSKKKSITYIKSIFFFKVNSQPNKKNHFRIFSCSSRAPQSNWNLFFIVVVVLIHFFTLALSFSVIICTHINALCCCCCFNVLHLFFHIWIILRPSRVRRIIFFF